MRWDSRVMSDTARVSRAQRRVGAAALASAVLFLVGCAVPAPTPSEESPQPAANATSAPKTPSPSPSLLSAMPPEVPFDFDASVLPDSWVLQWVDRFAGVPQFTVVPVEAPGEGGRIYLDELTQCDIVLFAGPDSTGFAPHIDDRTRSDAQLNSRSRIGEAAVAEFAIDHIVPQPGQNGSIAVRLILGAPGDGTRRPPPPGSSGAKGRPPSSPSSVRERTRQASSTC